ncbi:hypothetical protein GCM10007103_12920 [Salinimicrobium marinum]|uniref:DUF7793 domain-containing protein n=1 Tax=Salinimicrobium marinum TaxID=680283 RepID=A0A918VVC9_9FLAO|nr:hypothetical protein [Salinimicrobium marinum]GHA32889.1 hypothetical protein GCM10007103_12920 [Salinimicrobium marinum]
MTIENEYAKLWISEGILYFIYKPQTILQLDTAKKIVMDRLKLQNEISYPVLCDLRMVKDSEKIARDYLAREGSILTKAVAFLVEPPFSEATIYLYLRTSKPVIPTQIFTTKTEALSFLEKYKIK